MGTSRLLSPVSFEMRVAATNDYADKFPQSIVIFSGKQTKDKTVHPLETGSQYVEAAVMADEAIRRGLDPQRVLLEERAINAKENIENSLAMLTDEEQIVFISSDYLGRRIDLYLEKMRQVQTLPEGKQFYIFDADVHEDSLGAHFTPEQLERKRKRLVYEAKRIPLYRAKGDL